MARFSPSFHLRLRKNCNSFSDCALFYLLHKCAFSWAHQHLESHGFPWQASGQEVQTDGEARCLSALPSHARPCSAMLSHAQPCSAMLSLLLSQGKMLIHLRLSQIPYLSSCDGCRMISAPQRFSSNPAMDGFSTKKRAEAEMRSKLDADDIADQAMIPWMDVL